MGRGKKNRNPLPPSREWPSEDSSKNLISDSRKELFEPVYEREYNALINNINELKADKNEFK
jgi:hypothetical protein